MWEIRFISSSGKTYNEPITPLEKRLALDCSLHVRTKCRGEQWNLHSIRFKLLRSNKCIWFFQAFQLDTKQSTYSQISDTTHSWFSKNCQILMLKWPLMNFYLLPFWFVLPAVALSEPASGLMSGSFNVASPAWGSVEVCTWKYSHCRFGPPSTISLPFWLMVRSCENEQGLMEAGTRQRAVFKQFWKKSCGSIYIHLWSGTSLVCGCKIHRSGVCHNLPNQTTCKTCSEKSWCYDLCLLCG